MGGSAPRNKNPPKPQLAASEQEVERLKLNAEVLSLRLKTSQKLRDDLEAEALRLREALGKTRLFAEQLDVLTIGSGSETESFDVRAGTNRIILCVKDALDAAKAEEGGDDE